MGEREQGNQRHLFILSVTVITSNNLGNLGVELYFYQVSQVFKEESL